MKPSLATIPRSATSHVGAVGAEPIQLSSGARLQSLDAYRGLIMLTLLCGGIFQSLLDLPTWHWLAVQNEHVEWAGCVYWDLIQPSFMYMVGVSMPFALARREALGESWTRRLGHVLFRACNLLLLGILLDHFGADKIQIGFIRVLQQIAVGYVIAFFVVGRGFRTQGLVAAAILVGYQLIWMFNPWNDAGGPWAMGNENLGSAFDQWMLGRHYSGYYVGLNAIPSAVTIIFGVMAGSLIRQSTLGSGGSPERPASGIGVPGRMDSNGSRGRPTPRQVCLVLFIAGLFGIGLGGLLSPWFPLIKRIWTPSFAVYAGGWTTLFLLAFYWSVEMKGWKRWTFPLVVVGSNSIAAYVLGNAFGGWFRSASSAWISWLKPSLGDAWFPVVQHALFALAAWGVLAWLYRRKIFFKA